MHMRADRLSQLFKQHSNRLKFSDKGSGGFSEKVLRKAVRGYLRRAKKSSGGVPGGLPGLSGRVLEESRGPLGGVLGRPEAVSVKTFR